MSLLIKALDKAQAEKAQAKKSDDSPAKPQQAKKNKAVKQQHDEALATSEDLTLAPIDSDDDSDSELPAALKDSAAASPHQQETSQAPKQQNEQVISQQAQAANVFSSKRNESNSQTAKIAVGIGLFALLVLAAFAYWYQFVLNKPVEMMPSRAVVVQTTPAPEEAETTPVTEALLPEVQQEAPVVEQDARVTEPEANVAQAPAPVEQPSEAPISDAAVASAAEVPDPVENVGLNDRSIFETEDAVPVVDAEATLAQNEQVVQVDEVADAPVSSPPSVKVTKHKTETGVNATLQQAYDAYNAGDDDQARQQYQTVLKEYGMNVDAMLGLGAIATRQGRSQDAYAWYQKVLEVEPRNEVAQAGLLSLQANAEQGVSTSQLKSMLQASPNDANLQAALGDSYAQQGQWSDAQQAYFEAYRLKQSAENAFNLAVSLDQMGKPNVALPYYQEALQKVGQSSVIDRAALEARISSIE